MNEVYTAKEDCCGCSACVNRCPRQAITMVDDEQGFLYPQIDPQLCVDCGLCRQVCVLQTACIQSRNVPTPAVYAVKHKAEQIRMASSSGGMFTAISDYILAKSGVIYGASFDDCFRVCHCRATTGQERDCLRGAKYVQSDLRDIFRQVREDLEAGKEVLFSGTSCQVAGLQAYLAKDYTNLWLQDIVCHGVPSPLVFEDYKAYLRQIYQADIRELSFRHKYIDEKFGPSTQAMRVKFNNDAVYRKHAKDDIFYQLFLKNIILRPACYHCRYTNLAKPADITLADFWGLEKSLADFQDGKGVSLVLVNSARGQELFEAVSGGLDYRSSTVEDCLQPSLEKPFAKPPVYNDFWREYRRNFRQIGTKYTSMNWRQKVKRELRRLYTKLFK